MTTPQIEPGRLIKLVAENIMRLTAVEIDLPSSPVFIVGGKNGQGKTSLLSCIAIALGGAGEMPADPIRNGEEEAKILLTFENLVVKVKLIRNGDKVNRYLVIESTDGAKYGSPQALLEALTGKLAFDPLAFDALEPKAQVTALMGLVGVDVSKFDADRKTAYDKRTVENRELDRLKAELANTPFHKDAPSVPGSIEALNAEFQAGIEHNKRIEAFRMETERAKSMTRTCREKRAMAENEVVELETKLRSARAASENRLAEETTWMKRIQELEDDLHAAVPQDTNILVQRIQDVHAINAKVEANVRHSKVKDKITAQSGWCESLSHTIEVIDAAKHAALAKAEFPLEGLTFGDKGITFNGVPLSQTCGAERIAISTAIGLSLNPKLKLMVIRNGEKLDEDSLALVKQLAEQAGAQIIMERVGKGSECQIIIEEGQVSEVRP
jgi:DNA repair exonuclease SbcCD ATPase subunit